MRQNSIWALFATALAFASGCSSDSISTDNQVKSLGDSCNTSMECPENAECFHSVCTKTDKICGDKTCKDGQQCVKDECVDMCGEDVCSGKQKCVEDECVDMCGEDVCSGDQKCVGGQCKDKCGDIFCGANQACVEDECVDLCGSEVCKEGQICSESVCIEEELCGTEKCSEGEICVDEVCYPRGDCGGIQCEENQFCYRDSCEDKAECGGIYCDGGYDCVEGECVPSEFCLNGTRRCGESCCEVTQICGTSERCCERDAMCGRDCCTENEVCEYEMCHLKCEENRVRCQDSSGIETCCGEDEICVSNQCFKPSVSCIDNYICEENQFCDAVQKTCLPSPGGEVCKSEPKGGKVEPTLLWYWGETPPDPFPQYTQVMSSPMVADVNNDTIPEVVFNSYLVGNNWDGHGIVRIVNGQTGELIASSDGVPFTDGGSNVALGNLDDDPYIEIVTCDEKRRLIAYKFIPEDAAAGTKPSLKVMWKSTTSYNECYMHGPGIADFNGDGKPEVYGRYTVHDGITGEVIAHENCGDTTGNWAACEYSVAADINGDGIQELVGGNVVFNVDFENKTLVPLWRRTDMNDGYPALANLDLDPEGKAELVTIQINPSTTFGGTMMAFDAATGENFWPAPVTYAIGHGGAPTIANMNDTPEPEIAFAGSYGNSVFDYMGNHLWTRPSHDYSSGVTGSTVFDFDGDGKAEIVYADELFLRVYDGQTSETRFCACNTNCTLWEYPVVVDVNNDDHAEIIISSNNSCSLNSCPTTLTEAEGKDPCVDALIAKGGAALAGTHGVRAFASPDRDWVNTRKVYNQHAYSVTNVSDDASIPKIVKQNWKIDSLNNFRLNVQPGATYLPDLEIKDVSSPYSCESPIPIYFRVVNVGWATADKDIPVNVWAAKEKDGEYQFVGTVKTTGQIGASNSEYLTFNYENMAEFGAYLKLTFGDDAPEECRKDNNNTEYFVECPIN